MRKIEVEVADKYCFDRKPICDFHLNIGLTSCGLFGLGICKSKEVEENGRISLRVYPCEACKNATVNPVMKGRQIQYQS